jgi:hypothetical protein
MANSFYFLKEFFNFEKFLRILDQHKSKISIFYCEGNRKLVFSIVKEIEIEMKVFSDIYNDSILN